jgi:DNA mismatch endonuclease (patch repair protein)
MYKFVTSKKRSELMSKIRSSDTKPELTLRRKLWGQGFRFSRRISELPGKPDIVLQRQKVAIFIDGEFWHGYRWQEKRRKLKANRSYWIPKIERNIRRDNQNNRILKKAGWKILRFWEHEITEGSPRCITKIKKMIRSSG